MTEPAFVLHTRPWSETSLIAELLTPGQGRLGVMSRGGRRGRRGAAPALQPFTLLQTDWRGRGELRTLTVAEPERHFRLQGDWLYAGLYLNELLLRLLERDDAQPGIFKAYALALVALADMTDLEPPLRRFELHLLEALGYGFPLDRDIDGAEVRPGTDYELLRDSGLAPAGPLAVRDGPEPVRFAGAHLLALAADDFSAPAVRLAAKRLTRAALAQHLGGRPLRSRELFRTRTGG